MKAINKLIVTTLLGTFPLSLNAQSIPAFDKIRVASNASVNLIQGTPTRIVLEDEPGIDASRHYAVNDGWLVISGNPDDEINVTTDKITEIEISGVGKLETEGVFNATDITLRIAGAGKMELNLSATNIRSIISGAGKIELEGTASDMRIDISGSGKIDAENLKLKTCTANISGSGKCLVNVSDELTSNISGSGSVYYTTPPAKLNNNVSGVGKVADVNVAGNDTTRITLGKKNILVVDSEGKDVRISFKDGKSKPEELHGHWAGFELGVNMLMNKDFNTDMPKGYEFLEQKIEKSIAVNFNLADYEVKLYRKNIMLITGLGFSFNNYRFDSDAYLQADADSVIAYDDPGYSLKKNKLVVSYVTVPVLFEFNTSQNPRKTFHVALGMIGGLRAGSHTKVVKKEAGEETKHKNYDDFNLNPFRYDATVRLGYRKATLFASYSIGELFKDQKGPELHPLTLGIRVVGW